MKIERALLLMTFAACGSNPEPAPTWHRDVAPLVARHCGGCHAPGGLAPFSLHDFESARPHAAAIKAATQSGDMPPWHVDGSGACQTYRDDRSLSAAELDVLARWADDGAPEGTPAPPLPPSRGAALERVTHSVELEAAYVPRGDGRDDYRCFIVDPRAAADAFLTAYEVKPGAVRQVHHVLLFGLTNDDGERSAAELDAREAGPGWTCFGGPQVEGGFSVLAAWAPGTGATIYPAGTGVRVTGGHKAVLQVHYNLANGVAPDLTRVELQLEPSVTTEAHVLGMADTDLNLMPRQANAVETHTQTHEGTETWQLIGTYPHMHTLGRTLRVELERGGATSCVVDVPKWDFHWQQFYFYEQPIELRPGDRLTLRCGFDTTGVNHVVHWGEGTEDEMCLAGFYMARVEE